MRIYCLPESVIGEKRITILDRRQIHHLARVMRLRPGDSLTVFDGEENEYKCKIGGLALDRVDLSIVRARKLKKERMLNIALACAIPKKAKFDYIIEKVTELGIDRIIPLVTERTVVRFSKEAAGKKLERWQNIIRETAKQCGRIKLPKLEAVVPFTRAIDYIKDFDLGIIPNLSEKSDTLGKLISDFRGSSIIVFIGPEGDFSKEEIALAKKAGAIGVSLGELTLKVDTAAIAVVSFLGLSNVIV